MHYGVFEGQKAKDQPVKILILGESHHINKQDKDNSKAGREATYPTCRVVAEYLQDTEKRNRNLRFFSKIAKSFGVNTSLEDEADIFWSKVYFGNYIPVLCGVGDDTAANTIKHNDNRKEYNDSLFQFVNDNEIGIICCFGRRTYNALPSFYNKEENKGRVLSGVSVNGKTDYISKCVYLHAVEHGNTSITLNRDLEVFCMRHPSAKCGFIAENYTPILEGLIRK